MLGKVTNKTEETIKKGKENGILEAKESAIVYMNGCSQAEENEA